MPNFSFLSQQLLLVGGNIAKICKTSHQMPQVHHLGSVVICTNFTWVYQNFYLCPFHLKIFLCEFSERIGPHFGVILHWKFPANAAQTFGYTQTQQRGIPTELHGSRNGSGNGSGYGGERCPKLRLHSAHHRRPPAPRPADSAGARLPLHWLFYTLLWATLPINY